MEVKSINMMAAPTVPSFALPLSTIQWITCRERFSSKYQKSGFYFAHINKHNKVIQQNIIEFICKIEDLVGADKTKFVKTQVDFIIWIEPSEFWHNCDMRMSLFTILLYASLNYDGTNFENALFNHMYIKRTEKAVKRFLFGYTKFVKPDRFRRNWWVEFFHQKPETEIKKFLVSDVQENVFLGLNTLWT